MLHWAIVIFLTIIVLSAALPWLEKLGIGRLPGDFRFRLFGHTVFLPFDRVTLVTGVFAGASDVNIVRM